MKDHAVFTQVNDAILLHFESFSTWERSFLSDIQYKMINEYQISNKQRVLIIKILGKM